jgi:hypothetical protein
MTPPYCAVCGKDFRSEYFHTGKGGELIRFADYQPLPEGSVGIPVGAAWFCRSHVDAACSLSALIQKEALESLRQLFGQFSPPIPSPMLDPELWVIATGANLGAVARLVRSTSGWTPAQARERINAGSFLLISGWPSELARWEALLREAGATTEIRYP